MNERDDERIGPAEQRARDAVQALTAPAPDAAFRARLRESFASGAFPAPARRIVPLPWYRRAGGWFAVPAAAAAVIALVFVLNRGPDWSLAPMPGEGIVVVDGRPIPLQHGEDLARALRPGARVVVPDGSEMRLTSGAGLVVLATEGTEFVLPGAPGRWFGRTASARIERGTLRIATLGRFHGATLRVTTPEAEVMVTGSTLAIICEPAGTCVCVLDGHVLMAKPGGTMAPIEGGTRRLIFSDGRDEHGDMRPAEKEKLGMFREGIGAGA